jgi:hypothetical protein
LRDYMILAIDPGYTTGTAIATDIVSAEQFTLIGAFEVEWSKRFDFFSTFFRVNAAVLTAVIIEDFRLSYNEKLQRAQAGSRMPSSQMIGLIEALCYQFRLSSRLHFQLPVDYHNMHVLAQHIECVGLSRHNQVAYRHLRHYISMQRRSKR